MPRNPSRLLVLLVTATLASPALAREEPACSAPLGERPQAAGILIVPEAPGANDLPSLRVTLEATGHFMRVFFDEGSERAAWSRAACLGRQLDLLTTALGDPRRDAEWFSVVFTQDADYIPPRGPEDKERWPILIGADGGFPDLSQRMVVVTMPHEQVHDFQKRAGAIPPRWFSEGHATWVGLAITEQLDPAAARTDRDRLFGDLARSTSPANLAQWGSVRPRPEAIMRQVSAEDRARMQADPSYMPSGTFSFTSADLIGDESNMLARYAASLKVFEELEARHGARAVHDWAREVTAGSGRITPDILAESVSTHFGESLDDLLRDR